MGLVCILDQTETLSMIFGRSDRLLSFCQLLSQPKLVLRTESDGVLAAKEPDYWNFKSHYYS